MRVASQNGHLPVVAALLERGANVEAAFTQANNGMTALMAAVRNSSNFVVVKALCVAMNDPAAVNYTVPSVSVRIL